MYLQSFKLMIPFSELFPWPNICKVQKSPNCGLAFVLYDLSSLLSNQLISDFIFSFRSSHNLFLPASAFSIISSLWINYEKKKSRFRLCNTWEIHFCTGMYFRIYFILVFLYELHLKPLIFAIRTYSYSLGSISWQVGKSHGQLTFPCLYIIVNFLHKLNRLSTKNTTTKHSSSKNVEKYLKEIDTLYIEIIF